MFGWDVPGGGGSVEQAGLEEAGREDITSNSPLSYSSLFVTAASSYRLFLPPLPTASSRAMKPAKDMHKLSRKTKKKGK